MLRRFLRGLAAAPAQDTPETALTGQDLIKAFGQTLKARAAGLAADGGWIVLAIDGLDKLTEWQDLRWLPDPLPKGVVLVAAAEPSRAMEALIQRGCARQIVPAMREDERRAYIAERLGVFAKALEPHRLEKVATHPLTRLPITLVTIVNELRVFGRHADLDVRIDHYLAAASATDLFDRVLLQIENAIGHDGVARIMRTIGVSRAGIEEGALAAIAGISALDLSAALLRLGDGLWDFGGRLRFAHDHLINAVRARYLADPSVERAARAELLQHFDPRPLRDAPEWRAYLELVDLSREEHFERFRQASDALMADTSPLAMAQKQSGMMAVFVDEPPAPPDLVRRMDEAPFQLAAMQEASELREFLADGVWFNLFYAQGLDELRRLWRAAGCSAEEAEAALTAMIRTQFPRGATRTNRKDRLIGRVLHFLQASRWAGVKTLEVMKDQHARRSAVRGNVSTDALATERDLAVMEFQEGQTEAALKRIDLILADNSGFSDPDHPLNLNNQAERARFLIGMDRAREAEQVLAAILPKIRAAYGPDAHEPLSVARALANARQALGALEEAQALRQETLRQCTAALGQDDWLSLGLMSDLAAGMTAAGDAAGAWAMRGQVLQRRRVAFGDDDPATLSSLIAYGAALADVQRYDDAKAAFKEAIDAAAAQRDAHRVWQARRGLNDTLFLAGDLDEWLKAEQDGLAELDASGRGESAVAVDSMIALAIGHLEKLNRPDQAEAYFTRALAIESARPPADKNRSLMLRLRSSLAVIRGQAGDRKAAHALLEEAVEEALSADSPLTPAALLCIHDLLHLKVHVLFDSVGAIALFNRVAADAIAGPEPLAIQCHALVALGRELINGIHDRREQ